eukprot:gnl/TRDRNA2_/TRDRNA2_134882_c0_seq3.p2 gnl/TRDRNA2_/TRDRNA2_134882_c0~~gnl/TRDRNA2_/TRDRNA2_134882_c0_seq3.p2  ORF type:complete len:110 (-),score=17.97 gnl/TRDRNA2_/TRDRNA2_134882_c0_seq3:19-348(-)
MVDAIWEAPSGAPRIVYISTKPEPATRRLHEAYRKYDDMICALAQKVGPSRLVVIDSWTPLADLDEAERYRYFARDGLHLSAEGYSVWTRWVNEVLETDVGATPPATSL